MSNKKESQSALSEAESAQLQQLHTRLPEIAQALRASHTPAEATEALQAIDQASDAARLTLIKDLGREQTSDGPDVLLAIHTFSPHKESRKEARRSLIRLESVRAYPTWTPPAESPVISLQLEEQPPRFWKGLVTQMREQGEIQLSLCWEQGQDYRQTRLINLLLDFWEGGVRNFSTETGSKRSIDETLTKLTASNKEIKMVPCSLATGRRLLLEALDVNQWRGTRPHEEYRHHASQVQRLILDASDLHEEREPTLINPELDPEEVSLTFIGGWSMGDYGLTYDLLTPNSPIRANQTRAEWIEQHRRWADEAEPTRLELGFSHEREPAKSALWLPTPTLANRGPSRKEVEIGWSLEVAETPLSGTLKEMPMGTTINKETGRHWFWSLYTLSRETAGWRIQNISDEGARIQGLPIDELQKRSTELEEQINSSLKQQQERQQQTLEGDIIAQAQQFNLQDVMMEIARNLIILMHYDDALGARLSLDSSVLEKAYGHAMAIGNGERGAAYLERLSQRFPDRRTEVLRELAMTYAGLATRYEEAGLSERSQQLNTLVESYLQESIAAEERALSYIMLAQHKATVSQQLDEALTLFEKARTLNPTPPESTIIEIGVGSIADAHNRSQEALSHFQRAAEINPEYPQLWDLIGTLQYKMGETEAAVASLQQALKRDPADLQAYDLLTSIYMQVEPRQPAKARELLEQGLRHIPASAHLRALLTSLYLELGDRRRAQHYLTEAERIDPRLESVQIARELFNNEKKRV